ncbi:MAG: radical SAM protein, partial [Candidatus Korarchaeota archaeon]|nr:radical SAM protein [Candidatus Korarchaeota archaeon]
MPPRKVLILDGYTDEPAGLGVPPYIDVYPRYIAGAAWSAAPDAEVRYMTVDQARRDIHGFLKLASRAELLVVIAGVTVPGRYLSGHPLEPRELEEWFGLVEGPVKI